MGVVDLEEIMGVDVDTMGFDEEVVSAVAPR
jgi:hypothetical protein